MSSSRIDLGDGDYLTKGEKLFLIRRRLGLNQDERAKQLSLARHRYAKMERDEVTDVLDMKLLGGLKSHEKCVIYRRRCGQSQRKLAEEMKLSRVWVNKMESGEVDCTALVCHWEQ